MSFYDEVGGAETFERLVHAFYQGVAGDRELRALYPEEKRFEQFSDEARVVVSEPLGDLPGIWDEVPVGAAVIVQPGADQEVAFTPASPA